ncbi:MAG: S24 family peptidase [Acidobacteria bacterium]|nr:S24 family peptidase [Acidobacteriota bacterium]
MASLSTPSAGKYALVELHRPGNPVLPCGVLVWTDEEARLRLRRDWEHVTRDPDERDLQLMAQDLNHKLQEMGLGSFLHWVYSTLSNTFRLSDPDTVLVDSLERAAARAYERHISPTVLRYSTHLPLVNLSAAAGSWGAAMAPEALAEQSEDWVEVAEEQRIDRQMFAARVDGRSMEPEIPDGSLCIFRYQPAGSRDGRKVLVEHFGDATQRYTVKRYRSVKQYDAEGAVMQRRVILEPLNPEYEPWELVEGEECRVLAEFIAVL